MATQMSFEVTLRLVQTAVCERLYRKNNFGLVWKDSEELTNTDSYFYFNDN